MNTDTNKQKPTIGRIVIYRLNDQDANEINRNRNWSQSIAMQDGLPPSGIQYHFGNSASPGDEYPAIIVRVWGSGDFATYSLKVMLDGSDTYWANSRKETTVKAQGAWYWPERV